MSEDFWTYGPTGEKIPNEKKLDFVNGLINKYKKNIGELEKERDYYKELVINSGLISQKPLDYETIIKALELRGKGLSYKRIADELSISKTSAWNIINKYKEKLNIESDIGNSLTL